MPDASQPSPLPPRVVVADIDMPFWSMVVFMIKWTFASIPALLALALVGGAVFLFFTLVVMGVFRPGLSGVDAGSPSEASFSARATGSGLEIDRLDGGGALTCTAALGDYITGDAVRFGPHATAQIPVYHFTAGGSPLVSSELAPLLSNALRLSCVNGSGQTTTAWAPVSR